MPPKLYAEPVENVNDADETSIYSDDVSDLSDDVSDLSDVSSQASLPPSSPPPSPPSPPKKKSRVVKKPDPPPPKEPPVKKRRAVTPARLESLRKANDARRVNKLIKDRERKQKEEQDADRRLSERIYKEVQRITQIPKEERVAAPQKRVTYEEPLKNEQYSAQQRKKNDEDRHYYSMIFGP